MKQTKILKTKIRYNVAVLKEQMAAFDMTKRMNNFNWLRHEMSYSEPITLFHAPDPKKAREYIDYTYIRNAENLYDYIAKFANTNAKYELTLDQICDIHKILCAGTTLETRGGVISEINKRVHIDDMIYRFNADPSSILDKVFDLHYQLIELQPFEDFNKRTARGVMNMALVQHGYSPIVFNSKNDHDGYMNAYLARNEEHRDEYNEYMLNCMLHTQKQIMNVLHQSKIL